MMTNCIGHRFERALSGMEIWKDCGRGDDLKGRGLKPRRKFQNLLCGFRQRKNARKLVATWKSGPFRAA